MDATMIKALRSNKLPIESVRRKVRITRKRARGQRPYSMIRTILHGGHVFFTTVSRGRVKCMFMRLGHNFMRMLGMKKSGIIAQAAEI